MYYLRTTSDGYSSLLTHENSRVQVILMAETEITHIRRAVNMIAFRAGQPEFIDPLNDEVADRHNTLNGLLTFFVDNVADDQLLSQDDAQRYRNDIDELRSWIDGYIFDIVGPTVTAGRAGDVDGVMQMGAQSGAYIARITEIFTQLVEQGRADMNSQSYALANTVSNVRAIIMTLLTFNIIIGVLVAIFVIRAMSGPIKKVVALLGDVANGKLDVNVDTSGTNEIGLLNKSAKNMIDTIKHLVDDMANVRRIYRVEGNRSHRIPVDQYNNAFATMAGNINELFDDEVESDGELLAFFNEIKSGNFDLKVDAMPGDWKVLSDGLNDVMENLRSVSYEIKGVINAAAVKGDLEHAIDVSKFKGEWHSIMSGLNDICRAVDGPVVEIRDSLAILNKGYFNTQIAGQYTGDFLSIKNDFNHFIDETRAYINEINEVLAEIADGNLTQTIKMDFIGDYASIKKSIGTIVKTLNKTITDISNASDQVLVGSTQISRASNELAQGAQEQASAIQELNATIGVLDDQTVQNADSASSASKLSNKSATNASQGNDSMNEMLQAMDKIKESSNGISNIIKTIQDIAFQTNLLALNASVEAARAGDHGRGFSVVAEEVGTLAKRSQQAAAETTTLIEDSISRVASGSSIAHTTSGSLNVIVESAGEVKNIITDIAIASTNQAAAIKQIGEAVNQIAEVIQSSSASTQETASASQELNAQAELLKDLVSFFKVR